MKVAAIALELRRQKNCIGLVNLLRRISSAASRSPNAPVSRLDLIESVDAVGSPSLQG